MAFRSGKRKEVKKQSYYVWFLGAKESKGLRGEHYIRPVLRGLLDREKELEPMKVTLQVSSKGMKIIQNVPRKSNKGKTEQVKHFIPHHAITCVAQDAKPNDDIVCTILLIYNPITKCPVHVHAYRCDSVETAATLRNQLQILIDRPENQKKFHEIENRLDAKGLLPMKRLNSDGRSTRTEGSDRTDDSNESEKDVNVRKDHIANLYDSLAAELRERLKNSKSCPILLPPKDYDTVSRSKGKLNGIQYRKSTNIKLVGVNALTKNLENKDKSGSKVESCNKSTSKSSGKSSGIGSDEALSTAIQEVSSHPDFESKEIDPDTSSEEEEDWPEQEAITDGNGIMHSDWNRGPVKVLPTFKSRSKSPTSKVIAPSLDRRNLKPLPSNADKSYERIESYSNKKNTEKNSDDWKRKSRERLVEKTSYKSQHEAKPQNYDIPLAKPEHHKSRDFTPERKHSISRDKKDIWHYNDSKKPSGAKKEFVHPISIETCTRDSKSYHYVDPKDLPKEGRYSKQDAHMGKSPIYGSPEDLRESSYGSKDVVYRRSSNPPVDRKWQRDHRAVSYPNLLEDRPPSPADRYPKEIVYCDRRSVPYQDKPELKERRSHSPGHARSHADTLGDSPNYYSRRPRSPNYSAKRTSSPDLGYSPRSPEILYDPRKSCPPHVDSRRSSSPIPHDVSRRPMSLNMNHDPRRPMSPNLSHHDSRRAMSPNMNHHDSRRAMSPNMNHHDARRPMSPNMNHHDARRPMSPNMNHHDARRPMSPNMNHHDARRPMSPNMSHDPRRPSGVNYRNSRTPDFDSRRPASPPGMYTPRRLKSPEYEPPRRGRSPEHAPRRALSPGPDPRLRSPPPNYDPPRYDTRRSGSPERIYAPRGRRHPEGYVENYVDDRRKSGYFDLPIETRNYRNSFAENQQHRISLHQPQY